MPIEVFAPTLAFAGVVVTALTALLVRERRRNGNPGHNPGNPNGLRELKRDMHERFDTTQKTQTAILERLTELTTIVNERLPRR